MKKILATTTLSIACIAPAFGVLSLNLTFDEDSIAQNTTGKFSVSGSATSSNTSASRWITDNNGAPANTITGGNFGITVTGLTTTPTTTYNGNTVNYSTWVGSGMIEMYSNGSNVFILHGFNTSTNSNELLQIGNGTTDAITGTFEINSTPSSGTFSIEALNGSVIGTQADGITRSVNISASAIPEPSTYAALSGLAFLGFAGAYRWRTKRGVTK